MSSDTRILRPGDSLAVTLEIPAASMADPALWEALATVRHTGRDELLALAAPAIVPASAPGASHTATLDFAPAATAVWPAGQVVITCRFTSLDRAVSFPSEPVYLRVVPA